MTKHEILVKLHGCCNSPFAWTLHDNKIEATISRCVHKSMAGILQGRNVNDHISLWYSTENEQKQASALQGPFFCHTDVWLPGISSCYSWNITSKVKPCENFPSFCCKDLHVNDNNQFSNWRDMKLSLCCFNVHEPARWIVSMVLNRTVNQPTEKLAEFVARCLDFWNALETPIHVCQKLEALTFLLGLEYKYID